MLCNIIHSKVDFDLAMFDIIDSDLVRSRNVKSHCRINARLYSFVPRNINVWSSLPERLVKKCGTVQTFRRHLYRIDLSKILTNIDREFVTSAKKIREF